MAIWHFTCSLVPQKWLDHDVGRHLINRSNDKPNFEAAWRTRNEEFSIIEFCDSRFTRKVPCDQQTPIQKLQWDCGNGNEIHVAIGHDTVTGVKALIDTRQAYGDFSTVLMELSVLTGCMLHFEDSGRIVEPVMETLVAAIGGSEAARAARDPGNSVKSDASSETELAAPITADINSLSNNSLSNEDTTPASESEPTDHRPLRYANLT